LAAKSPQEAVEAFLTPFKAVVGCITGGGFVARIRRPGGPYPATFQSGFAELARSGGRPPIQLTLTHTYYVVPEQGQRGPWRVTTAGWIYKITDAEGELIFAFHWHPEGSGRATWPHLHANGSHPAFSLERLHPPTGRVSIEAVVRFLIEDLDVVPRKEDWRIILDNHERQFWEMRTWA
jgi:hypothetical protein